jgi:hypothetical protein
MRKLEAHHLRGLPNLALEEKMRRASEGDEGQRMLREYARTIENQQQLDAIMQKVPPYARAAGLEQIRPYLKFTINEPESVQVGQEADGIA